MEQGKIQIYYGNGQGKSSAAIGNAIRLANQGKNSVVIEFLKGENPKEFIKRLEPEIRFFRFEQAKESFDELTEKEREEEKQNIQNGLNYAKKVLVTEECDLLILDEILGAIDEKIISQEELIDVLKSRSLFTEVILTGRTLSEEILNMADEVIHVTAKKQNHTQV